MPSDLERLERNSRRITFWLGFFTAILFLSVAAFLIRIGM